jgi:hypothetical protein
MSRNKTIEELPEILPEDINDSDVMAIDDLSASVTKKVTIASLKEKINEGVVIDIDGAVAALIQDGLGISWSYNDLANTLTPTVNLSAFDTDDLPEGSTNLYYTDARVETYVNTQKGAVNGLATLGADQKIPTSQLPALAITETFVVLDQTEMLALTAQTGDVAIRVDLNKSFILSDNDPSILANWKELLTPTDSVLSVNGQTGAVTLTTSHIGEGSNLYFTNARARSAISSTATGLDYDNSTGVFSATSGYGIPTTTKQTQWDTAYGWGNHASVGYLTSISGLTHSTLGGLTTGDAGHTQFALLAGRTGGQSLIGGSAVTDILSLIGTSGNGTLTSPAVQVKVGNNGATTAITVLNNGNVGIGTTTPSQKLSVIGGISADTLYANTLFGSGFSAITFSNFLINASQTLNISRDSGGNTGVGGHNVYIDNLSAGTNAMGLFVKAGVAGGTGYIAKFQNRAGVEALFLSSAGNVGIGTTTPGGKLWITQTADTDGAFRLDANRTISGTNSIAEYYNGGVLRSRLRPNGIQDWFLNTGVTEVGSVSFTTPSSYPGIGIFGTDVNSRAYFLNTGSSLSLGYSVSGGTPQQLHILANGNIGIGTTSPSARLHIISTTEQFRAGYDASIYWNATTANTTGITTFNAVGGTTPSFVFSDPVSATTLKVTTVAGYISSDGSTGATGTFTTTDLKTVTVKDGLVTAIV